MIDLNARNQLQQRQATNIIADGIAKLADTIAQSQVKVAQTTTAKTPAGDLAEELRSLQKTIGTGNLTESLGSLVKALDSFQVDKNSLAALKGLVADLSAKVAVLTTLEAKLPRNIALNFPKTFPVTGNVDVGNITSLPPVKITNLSEVTTRLGQLIDSFQAATIKAIASAKPEIPDSVSIKDPIEITNWQELIDGIEELKKGFNLLINKENASGGVFNKDGIQQMELVNFRQMIPTPVTNININPLRGLVATTAVTVTTTPTKLPGNAQANRRALVAYNNSAATTIYIGGSDVTSANGMVVPAGTASPSFDIGPNVLVYAVTSSGTADVRVMEVSSAGEGGSN